MNNKYYEGIRLISQVFNQIVHAESTLRLSPYHSKQHIDKLSRRSEPSIPFRKWNQIQWISLTPISNCLRFWACQKGDQPVVPDLNLTRPPQQLQRQDFSKCNQRGFRSCPSNSISNLRLEFQRVRSCPSDSKCNQRLGTLTSNQRLDLSDLRSCPFNSMF